MNTYEISNTLSGVSFGEYKGANREEALDAYARAAGYSNFAAACDVAPVAEGEIEVTLLESEALTLKENGVAAVSLWVREVGIDGLQLEAFFSDAEHAAEGFENGETPVIEIHSGQSRTGNPVTLRLNRDWFV